ncbi:MAG: hypothetical protein CEE42_08445 [Promethearchaeota archaeon Loki_b31]|nr:MAG: hypothetical protein CEE42_08445 [Candidatus Lokiarchaeota archaeon Loki_b31]
MLLFIAQESNAFLDWISFPPGSMIFILLMASVTAIISTALTKWLIDTDEINRKQVISKAHDEEKKKIIELAETDPEKYNKLRKRWERLDSMLKQSQQKMALRRMLPSCITIVPMMILFALVGGVFGGGPVALSPMNANDVLWIGNMMAGTTGNTVYPWTALVYGVARTIRLEAGWINFTAWYILCSFGVNTLVQRIFKLQTQASGGMEQMMGGGKAKALEFPDV